MLMPLPISLALQQGIAAILRLDTHTANALDTINGKVIRVEVTAPSMECHLIVVDGTVQVEGQFDDEPDTTITGSAADLLSLTKKTDALYTGAVRISGDVQTGEHIRSIINDIDIELADVIAPVTGDTLAHQIGLFTSQLAGWFSETGNSLKRNTSEYLQEEAELLAPNSEVRRFCSEVDLLQDAYDRLSARLNLLEQANKKS